MKERQINHLDKGIFWFYEWGLKIMPVVLMLVHWYGVYDFHSNPREILVCVEENEVCIAYLYFMSYLFPVLFMLPASLFYGLCWIYRLPFTYFIGVSVIRLYHGSWLITNEMEDMDFCLILFTLVMYAYGVIRLNGWRISKLILKLKERKKV